MRSYVGSYRQSVGFRLGRCINVPLTKRTCIHFFGTRKQLIRRDPTRPAIASPIGLPNTSRRCPQYTNGPSTSSWGSTNSSQGSNRTRRRAAAMQQEAIELPSDSGSENRQRAVRERSTFLLAAVRVGQSPLFLSVPTTAKSKPLASPLPNPIPESSSRLLWTVNASSVRPTVNYAVALLLLNQKHQLPIETRRLPFQSYLGVAELPKMARWTFGCQIRSERIGSRIDFVVSSLRRWYWDDKKRVSHRLANSLLLVEQIADRLPAAVNSSVPSLVNWSTNIAWSTGPITAHLRMQGWNQMGIGTGMEWLVKCISLDGRIAQLLLGIEQMARVLRYRFSVGHLINNEVNPGCGSWLSHRTETLTVLYSEKLPSTSFFQSAYPIAQYLSSQPRKQATRPLRISRFIESEITSHASKDLLGLRISVSGRLEGAARARTESSLVGKTSSAHVWDPKIDYATAGVNTRFGIIGVKVWISFH